MSDKTARKEALDAWEAAFGITRNPFRDRDQPFLPLGQRDEALASLRHLALFSHKLLVLTGPSGSGKSALLRELLASQDGSMVLVVIKGGDVSDLHGLIDRVLSELGLVRRGESIEESSGRIREACAKRSGNGLKTILAIDDAETLSVDMLNWLATESGAGTDDVSVVLACRDGLWAQLRNALPDLVEKNLLGRVPLRPYGRAETRIYLEEGLKRAGWDGTPVVTDSQVQAIFGASHGLPGLINRLAENYLVGSSAQRRVVMRWNARNWSILAMVGGSLIVAWMLVLWLYQERQDEPPVLDVPGMAPVAVESERVSLELVLPQSESVEEGGEKDWFEENAAELSTPSEAEAPAPDPELDLLFEQEPLGAGMAEDAEGLPDPARPDPAESLLADPVMEDEPEQPVPEVVVPEQKADADSLAQAGEAPASRQEPVPQGTSSLMRPQSWMNQQDAQGWTVQLLGSQDEESANSYAAGWTVAPYKPFYFKSDYRGKPWYVVLLGVFPDKEAARKAMDGLPQRIRKQGPWLRSIKGLQKSPN